MPDTSGSKGLFAAATLLIVLALGWYFYGQPSFRKGDVTTPAVADPNSIAVLPFANMSGKSDEDYFSDGMTEELLNVLAKVPQLKVVARTSVFQFKSKGGDVREIGRKLGVTNIVEGSVRRDGPRGAHHRAVGARGRRLSHLVGDLRSQTGASVRAAGRDRATHRRCAQAFVRRCGAGRGARADRSRSLRRISQGPGAATPASGPAHCDRALQEGSGEGAGVCGRLVVVVAHL